MASLLRTRVVVIDDHELVRDGLEEILAALVLLTASEKSGARTAS